MLDGSSVADPEQRAAKKRVNMSRDAQRRSRQLEGGILFVLNQLIVLTLFATV